MLLPGGLSPVVGMICAQESYEIMAGGITRGLYIIIFFSNLLPRFCSRLRFPKWSVFPPAVCPSDWKRGDRNQRNTVLHKRCRTGRWA